MASLTEITTSQLAKLVGTPDCPMLLDVRIDEDFEDAPTLIPGAKRISFRAMNSFAAENGGSSKRVIIYCQKGLKISLGAAAILRDYGWQAETLKGGHLGWRDAGLPLIPAAVIPAKNEQGRTVWVTRQRPKIDRIACPWLIRRFIDPEAQFLFVPASQVLPVAEKFEATPFDVEGAFWTHHDDCCTFDAMLDGFSLKTDALIRLAAIVRAADTNRHDLAPEAAGLLAASLGLSRMYRDDLQQLEVGLGLYDAFYRWARDAGEEGHDWDVEGPVK